MIFTSLSFHFTVQASVVASNKVEKEGMEDISESNVHDMFGWLYILGFKIP